MSPTDYRHDTNDGCGWSVWSQWQPISGESHSPEHTTDYATLGQAHREGLQLACLKGVLAVAVIRPDDQEHPVCSYQRSDNIWRDHLASIREWEQHLTQLDMAGHMLNQHRGPITDRERLVVLQAVAIGGGTAHDRVHNVCSYLVTEGLLATWASGWQLTPAGTAWLGERLAD